MSWYHLTGGGLNKRDISQWYIFLRGENYYCKHYIEMGGWATTATTNERAKMMKLYATVREHRT